MKTTQHVLITVLFLGLAACGPQNPNRTESLNDSTSTGIVGGVAVTPEDTIAKSTVGIESGMYGVFCSGVLVAKNLVLTAGHCTGVTSKPNQMSIVFGTDLQGKVERRRVLGGRVHPNWPALAPEQDKNWGDIAVLLFEGEAPAGFAPVAVLTSNTNLKNGTDVVLAGYGLIKMKPDVDPFKLMKATVKLSNVTYTETEILFEQYNGKGACHGDSGGPAFIKYGKEYVLIGVTSRSATEAGAETCLEGSVYSSIAGHLSFLKTAVAELRSPAFVPNESIPQPIEPEEEPEEIVPEN